ncbi:unnamed protein product [Zymoseptoria tritici ST99CH_3D7]|uniref:Uncharacterized protein n=1 Tax=Zymoseptoria tritici (strain ST99CH_3D7) TaxID=1276538 RepID=A0A1X7S591_ZYMT9|nr:unnamed protein product [Zymoseptoria tritici ST99CH_3D7]
MKTACALLFAAVAAAGPIRAIPPGTTFDPLPDAPLNFTATALYVGGDLGFPINANDKRFWIGKDTRTFSEGQDKQANTDKTIFSFAEGTGQLNLDVNVPGGQRVYVRDDGQLRFVEAHRLRTDGHATFTGFEIGDGALLKFEAQDWIMCPKEYGSSEFKVWAASRVQDLKEGCVRFEWQNDYTRYPEAWAYY